MAHGVNQEWEEGTSPPSSVKRVIAEVKKPIKSEGKVMGSRRIFSPQFKLQVLDSYRNDSDCKGNQRATARKYGIHRRQIQKWLQMESQLRSTVEDTAASETTALNLSSPRQRDVEEPCRTGCLIQADPAPIPEPSNSSHDDSDIEINVDGNSSSEEDFDDNSSSTSTYGQTDQALDFTCAALSKRRFFSTEFKLGVLDAFYHDESCTGNQRATARKFGINRRQIQKWLQQEPMLRGECLDLSCKRRKLNDDSPPPPPQLLHPPCINNYTPPPTATILTPSPPVHNTIMHEVTTTCCSMDLYNRPPQWCYVPTYDPPPPWPYPHHVYLPTIERPPLEQDLKCFRHQTLLYPPSTNEIKILFLHGMQNNDNTNNEITDSFLTNEKVKRRYRDTALLIHEENEKRKMKTEIRNNYLSFGINRRTAEYNNNGNHQLVIVRHSFPQPKICSVMPKVVILLLSNLGITENGLPS